MIATLYLVLFMVGEQVKIVPAKTIAEVCALKRKHQENIVFRVDGYQRGRWDLDAHMRAVLVECQEEKK